MFILYDLVFLIFALVWLPVYLFRRKFHHGFAQRLGNLPQNIPAGAIWLHAVSVGEAMAARPLLEELRRLFPDRRFVISTVTPTGNKIALGLARDGDAVIYLPLDFSFIVKRVIGRIKPALFIGVETELWPNLISSLAKNKVPMVIVNARISDRSFRGYRLIKLLIRPLLNKISAFCARSQTDEQRLMALGANPDKVRVSGNLKFDTLAQVFNFEGLRLGLADEDQLWVAGSTHPGEEEIVLGVYKSLLSEFPKLKLLIAPRHPERAKAVGKLVSKCGFSSLFISSLEERTTRDAPACPAGRQRTTVFILDTIGQLMNCYALADIVFSGGSLVKKGGHNILEPAVLGKAILFGPQMFNFRDVSELFLKSQAAILVHGKEELREQIGHLLHKPGQIAALGQRAKGLVLENQGAARRNAEIIRKVYAHIFL
jgi:3-deoxy-D-manno-octulosonic-acid transferase